MTNELNGYSCFDKCFCFDHPGVPSVIRGDCGVENITISTILCTLRRRNCFWFGASTENTVIQASIMMVSPNQMPKISKGRVSLMKVRQNYSSHVLYAEDQ